MARVMAVSFERYGRLYYLDPGEIDYAVGDRVLVPTESGPEVAECVWAPEYVADADFDDTALPVCAGKAEQTHLDRDAANRRIRAQAKLVAKRLIKRHGLPMKVMAVDYVDSGADFDQLIVIYFTAPHRVDFRTLVGELARSLQARIDLRQVGARDAARHDQRSGQLRPRAVLRDLPDQPRAGQPADGQGAGPAAEPAADLRCLRSADVLPEVRAPAVRRVRPRGAGHRQHRHHRRGRRRRRRPLGARRTRSWSG